MLGLHSLSGEGWKRGNCHMKQLSLSLDLKVPIVGSVWDFNWQCIPKSSLLALMNVWNCLLVYSLPLLKKEDLTIPAIVFSFCCFPLATGAYSFSETQKLVSQATAEPCSMQGDSLILREALGKVVRDCFSALFVPIICSCLLG